MNETSSSTHGTTGPQNQTVLFLKPPSGKPGQNVVRDFVYGCWCNGRRVGGMEMPPLNDLYVATHARQQGIEVMFLDAQVEPERFEQWLQVDAGKALVVVILTSTQSFQADAGCLAAIKSRSPRIKTIMFGSHPTFMPEFCLKHPAVDFIILREPEASIRELLGSLLAGTSLHSVRGIGFKGPDGNPILNPVRPFIPMDELPIPDRTLLPRRADYFNPVVKRLPYTTMQTSRGCPGRCIFCTAPTFYGNKYRYRSVEKVLEELREIKRLGFREVFFRDETFTALGERNQQICEAMLRENLDLSWIANGRVDMVDQDMLQLMKRAGCHLVKFGVESGSDNILKNYRKGTTTNQATRAFAMAKNAGLDTHAHLVFGGPGETRETIRQTITFVLALSPSTASFGILTPYPGTELFDLVAKKRPEILDGSGSNMENLHTTAFFSQEICGLDNEFLSKAITRAYRKFYLRPGYLLKKFSKIDSFEELLILAVAGLNIIYFAATGEK